MELTPFHKGIDETERNGALIAFSCVASVNAARYVLTHTLQPEVSFSLRDQGYPLPTVTSQTNWHVDSHKIPAAVGDIALPGLAAAGIVVAVSWLHRWQKYHRGIKRASKDIQQGFEQLLADQQERQR